MKYNELKGFPLQPHSKLPAIKKWQAQSEYKMLRDIGATNKGVLCGRKNKLLVVDCDVKGKENGIESFNSLLKDLSIEVDTLTIATPSGGMHYYFRLPDDALDLRKQPREDMGIDFQMEGSFVVAHGSNIDKERRYNLFKNRPIQMVPPALLEWLRNNAKNSTGQNTPYPNAKGKLNRSLKVLYWWLANQSGKVGSQPWLLNCLYYELKKATNLDEKTVDRFIKVLYSYIYGELPNWDIDYSHPHSVKHENALSRFIEEILETKVGEGGRNNSLARMSGVLALGTNDFNMYKWLCKMYMDICFTEPLESEEFELTITSIWSKEKGRGY